MKGSLFSDKGVLTKQKSVSFDFQFFSFLFEAFEQKKINFMSVFNTLFSTIHKMYCSKTLRLMWKYTVDWNEEYNQEYSKHKRKCWIRCEKRKGVNFKMFSRKVKQDENKRDVWKFYYVKALTNNLLSFGKTVFSSIKF